MSTDNPTVSEVRRSRNFLIGGSLILGFFGGLYAGSIHFERVFAERAARISASCITNGLLLRFNDEYYKLVRTHGLANYSVFSLWESYFKGNPISYENFESNNAAKHPLDYNINNLIDAAKRGRRARSELEKSCSI